MANLYCVIMAGGKGERFWPLSTESRPKPFVRLLGERTMIQETLLRARSLAPLERILVVLAREHLDAAKAQLPSLGEEHYLVEPSGRDTAACIGFAASVLAGREAPSVMAVMPADHFIPDAAEFIDTIVYAAAVAERTRSLVTIGIRPTRPETGYGYICCGEPVDSSGDLSAFSVNRFVEKPDSERAAAYVADGRYLWNAGIFVWRTDVVLEGIGAAMPELAVGLGAVLAAWRSGDWAALEEAYGRLPRKSIDYGLMEKAPNVLVVPARFRWDDVGTWASLSRVAEPDGRGNVAFGDPLLVDTGGSVVYDEGIGVGVIGVSDLIVIASEGGVLVCHKSRAQEVREIARGMEGRKASKKDR